MAVVVVKLLAARWLADNESFLLGVRNLSGYDFIGAATVTLDLANEKQMSKDPTSIVTEAYELLKTAEFGLEDMISRPGRAKTGLRNAVVFGRNTTWALQNLKDKVPGFNAWYDAKQAQIKEDSLMRFFHDLRTSIEKKASTPTTTSVHIKSFSTSDMHRFEPRPPGATGFFMGDQNGGSGWIVKTVEGAEESYYVDLPEDIGTVTLSLIGAPKLGDGKDPTAVTLVKAYLKKIRHLVIEAQQMVKAGSFE